MFSLIKIFFEELSYSYVSFLFYDHLSMLLSPLLIIVFLSLQNKTILKSVLSLEENLSDESK